MFDYTYNSSFNEFIQGYYKQLATLPNAFPRDRKEFIEAIKSNFFSRINADDEKAAVRHLFHNGYVFIPDAEKNVFNAVVYHVALLVFLESCSDKVFLRQYPDLVQGKFDFYSDKPTQVSYDILFVPTFTRLIADTVTETAKIWFAVAQLDSGSTRSHLSTFEDFLSRLIPDGNVSSMVVALKNNIEIVDTIEKYLLSSYVHLAALYFQNFGTEQWTKVFPFIVNGTFRYNSSERFVQDLLIVSNSRMRMPELARQIIDQIRRGLNTISAENGKEAYPHWNSEADINGNARNFTFGERLMNTASQNTFPIEAQLWFKQKFGERVPAPKEVVDALLKEVEMAKLENCVLKLKMLKDNTFHIESSIGYVLSVLCHLAYIDAVGGCIHGWPDFYRSIADGKFRFHSVNHLNSEISILLAPNSTYFNEDNRHFLSLLKEAFGEVSVGAKVISMHDLDRRLREAERQLASITKAFPHLVYPNFNDIGGASRDHFYPGPNHIHFVPNTNWFKQPQSYNSQADMGIPVDYLSPQAVQLIYDLVNCAIERSKTPDVPLSGRDTVRLQHILDKYRGAKGPVGSTETFIIALMGAFKSLT